MNISKVCYTLVAACALAGTGHTTSAAEVNISLNLFYDSPANPSLGGSWELVAKTDSLLGISAINFILANIDNGIFPDEIFLEPDIGAIDPIDPGGPSEGPPYIAFGVGGVGTDLLYGQDISIGALAGVGTLSMSDGPDPFGDPFWDDATRIATGTFGGAVQPSFTTNGLSVTAANVFSSVVPPINATGAMLTTTVVRSIPEPSAWVLMSLAIIGFVIFYRWPSYARAAHAVSRGY